MKDSQKILTKISSVFRDIEENYPELQKYLCETRSTLSVCSNNSSSLTNDDLENYLNELIEMVNKYKKRH